MYQLQHHKLQCINYRPVVDIVQSTLYLIHKTIVISINSRILIRKKIKEIRKNIFYIVSTLLKVCSNY